MTEYELADLMGNVSADSLVFIPVLLTVASGYLVAAWTVGRRLTRSQVSLVNSLFVGASLVFLAAWSVRIRVALAYQSELIAINPERLPLVNSWLQPAVYVMGAATLAACLKFMWDIRNSSPD